MIGSVLAVRNQTGCVSNSALGGRLGEGLQQPAPSIGRIDSSANRLALVAETFEVAVLELDAGGIGAVRMEAHFHFSDHIGIKLEFAVQLPAEHHACGRIPHQHTAPLALGAVLAALEPAAANARLD